MDTFLAAHRLLWLAALAWWVSRVASVRRPPEADSPPAPVRLYAGLVLAGFATLFGWQAFWTLRAEAVPAFRRVERHDPRAWRLTSPADRRVVVDRTGLPLIVNTGPAGALRRAYPCGQVTAHLTGYFNRRYGKAGLEAACDDLLSTWRQPSWDRLRDAESTAAGPAPLRVTIDYRLQQAAFHALGRRCGAVVVLSPAAGDVLAMVSTPSFDPNRIDPETFADLATDPASPLLNRAWHGLYPPGSTFKPLVAGAALAAGWSPATRFTAPPAGYLAPYDTKRIKDHEAGELGPNWKGHGELDMMQALACSSNGYFAWLSGQLGSEVVVGAARACGLDRRWDAVRAERSDSDLISTPGSLPATRMKPGELARCGIGQDQVLVTPLGMALCAATIANYGRLLPPRLRVETAPGPPEIVLPAAVAAKLQQMMRGVVAARGGTGRGLRGVNPPVAAKTGSAENGQGDAHAWVIAFAPYQRATLALAVLVEHGGTGSGAAVPIARRVLQAAADAGYFRGGQTP